MKFNPLLFTQLDKLPYFLAVAEERSFRKASKVLNITQPAISKAIKNMEEACDCIFFKRSSEGVRLTQEGELLLKIAHEIKQKTQVFHHELKCHPEKKNLRLATHEVILPLLIRSLDQTHQTKLSMNITTHPSVSRLLKRLEDYESDIAIVAGVPESKNIHRSLLFRDHYRFFISPELQKKEKSLAQVMSLSDLAKLPLIFTPNVLSSTQLTFEQSFRQKGIELRPHHVVESLETAAALIASGYGIGILPEKTGSFLTARKIVPLPIKVSGLGDLGTIDFNFCCRKESWKNDLQIQNFFTTLSSLGRHQ